MKLSFPLKGIAVLYLIAIFAFTSCTDLIGLVGGDNDEEKVDQILEETEDEQQEETVVSTTNTVLPNMLLIPIPQSLTGTDPALASIQGRYAIQAQTVVGDTGLAAEAYLIIKTGVTSLEGSGGMLALYTAIIDEVIFQNSLSPSDTLRTGMTLAATQGFINKVNAIATANGFEAETEIPVGQELEVPPFTYKSVNDGIYSYALEMTEVNTEGTSYTAINWSTDRKKVKMIMSDNPDTSNDTYRHTLGYDDETKTSSMVMEMSWDEVNIKYAFSLKKDPASTKNGAFLFFENSGTYVVGEETVPWSETGKGYADDEGGTLDLTRKSGSGIDFYTESHSISFNASDIDTSVADTYDDYAAQIDQDMYDEVSQTQDLSGETVSEGFLKVYTLPQDITALSEECMYFLLSGEWMLDQSTAIQVDSNATMEAAFGETSNYDELIWLGGAWASGPYELTVYFEGEIPTSGYLYSLSPSGEDTLVNLVKFMPEL